MNASQILDADTEIKLIRAAKQCEEAAQEELIKAYQPLIFVLARRFGAARSITEELTQAGAIGLLQAVRRYDETCRVKLITYAVPWILGEMRSVLRAYDRNQTRSFDNDGAGQGINPENMLGMESINLAHLDLRLALEHLDRDERLLLYLRYYRDKTQKETADLLGKSQAQISKIEQRTLDVLRSMLL